MSCALSWSRRVARLSLGIDPRGGVHACWWRSSTSLSQTRWKGEEQKRTMMMMMALWTNKTPGVNVVGRVHRLESPFHPIACTSGQKKEGRQCKSAKSLLFDHHRQGGVAAVPRVRHAGAFPDHDDRRHSVVACRRRPTRRRGEMCWRRFKRIKRRWKWNRWKMASWQRF